MDMGSFAVSVLADGAATSGGFAVLETHGEGTGFGPPMHIHRDAAEAFYVLEGTYQMYFENREELALRVPSSTCRSTRLIPSNWSLRGMGGS